MKTKTTPIYQHFEAAVCGRCGGSGHFSYNQLDGTLCYGCSGKGMRFTKRGAKGYNAYVAALESLRRPSGRDIVPGTVLSVQDRDGVNRWHRVVSADLFYTDELVAASIIREDDGAPRYEAVLVLFEDGEQDVLSANQIHRGRATREDVERVLGSRVEDLPGYVEEPSEGWNS